MNTTTFGTELRRLRRAADLTLADLADHLNCSVVYLSSIERGEKAPPAPAVIAKLMNRIGHPELVDEMVLLAVRSRRAVEISMENKAEAEKDLLAALARKSDAGEITPELARELLGILNRKTNQ